MYLSARLELSGALAGQTMNQSAVLPNPLTPMAFFPPTLAYEFMVGAYVTISALVIMIWEFLDTIGSDYILLTQHKIKLGTIVYFISRLSTFGWLLSTTIFDTAPFGACKSLAEANKWLCNIAIPSSSFLLFLRVQALYSRNKIVVSLFILLWAGVCGVGVMSTKDLSGTKIGPTQYCIEITVPQDAYMFGIAVLVNDTLTLLVVSWRLRDISLKENSTLYDNLRTIIIGSNLPSFSKAFLHDGQKYYLTTVGFSIFATITLYLDVVPLPFRGVVGTLDVLLLNVMTCRVFRNTKLGLYREEPETICCRVVNEHRATTAPTDAISNPNTHSTQP